MLQVHVYNICSTIARYSNTLCWKIIYKNDYSKNVLILCGILIFRICVNFN